MTGVDGYHWHHVGKMEGGILLNVSTLSMHGMAPTNPNVSNDEVEKHSYNPKGTFFYPGTQSEE